MDPVPRVKGLATKTDDPSLILSSYKLSLWLPYMPWQMYTTHPSIPRIQREWINIKNDYFYHSNKQNFRLRQGNPQRSMRRSITWWQFSSFFPNQRVLDFNAPLSSEHKGFRSHGQVKTTSHTREGERCYYTAFEKCHALWHTSYGTNCNFHRNQTQSNLHPAPKYMVRQCGGTDCGFSSANWSLIIQKVFHKLRTGRGDVVLVKQWSLLATSHPFEGQMTKYKRDWRGGSAVKSTLCPFSGPEFDSQWTHGSS